jgi:hypothetical protein
MKIKGLVPVTMLNIGHGWLVPVTMLNIRRRRRIEHRACTEHTSGQCRFQTSHAMVP